MCVTCSPEIEARPALDAEEHLQELRRLNRDRRRPLATCPDCRIPTMPDDFDWLYPALCATCAARKLDKLLCRLARRLGRKGAIKALKRLAK